MSERWARAAMTSYRLAGASLYPFIGGYMAWRTSRGKEEKSRRKERYGHAHRQRPEGPLIWVHAASVGETGAVIPLIDRLCARGLRAILTTGTVTSAQLVRDRLGDKVIHQYVPLDLKPAISRFLNHWKPDLAVFAESELWPMTILELGARHIPQVLINARLSDRSFERWTKWQSLAEALLEHLSAVVAQSDLDGERFRALGARPVTVSGNLKVDSIAPPVDDLELARLAPTISGRSVWAAISTHDGEEAIAGQVHMVLKPRVPGLLSVIVPRHPERGDTVEAMLREKGLTVARRSRGDAIDIATDVFLGDTIGEMGLYLRLTEIAFVGRSLTAEGGQNPIEPAVLDTAILTGKNVQNFRDAYRRLLDTGGARLVRDGDMLAKAVYFLLKNDAARRGMIAGAREGVGGLRGALEETLDALEPWIQPLVVKAQLQSVNGA